MRHSRDIMGMPVRIEVVGDTGEAAQRAFDYFEYIDRTFSTYKEHSEISRFNRGETGAGLLSDDMREVLERCEETRRESAGYFDIRRPDGIVDPSGLVKGWAINNAARMVRELGYENYYVEAGGDIQTGGVNERGDAWRLGIRNPFEKDQIVKAIVPRGRGVATSGTYERGRHIYDPHTGAHAPSDLASLTVIGPDVYEADRFATAAFAMGIPGLSFIEGRDGFEAFMIDSAGSVMETTGFSSYVC